MPITESIYASGTVKSRDQYEVAATVNGVIEVVYVEEGDTVKAGTPLFSISNDLQRLQEENAALSAGYANANGNQNKLNEAKLQVDVAKQKMENDSLMYFRQKALWQQQIGTKVELEQRALSYQHALAEFESTSLRYIEMKRQINFTAAQAGKNLLIAKKQSGDYIVRSEIDGVVFSIFKTKGDLIGPQTPLCVVGDASQYILEMYVDEYDIFKLKKGMPVEVTLDSYKGQVFTAVVTTIGLLMNERSKSFLVEAMFLQSPPVLYPNVSFEANIVIARKEKALVINRSFLLNDSVVIRSNGEQVTVKTGLKDNQFVEILSGVSKTDELKEPEK